MDAKNFIAKRVSKELKDGDVVNLGIGLPTLVANYIPEDIDVIFQSENGILGLGPVPEEGKEDKDIFNAGGKLVTVVNGAQFFSSADSFGIIRGGHVNVSVLGALQVDENADIASWCVPGKKIPGMGGAMDLVAGSKRIIVAMLHTQNGTPKILKKCTYPLTGKNVVDTIVTEMCVMRFINGKLTLTEYAPGYSIEDIKKATEADFAVAEDLKEMEVF